MALVLACAPAWAAEDPAKPLYGKWTLDKVSMVESLPAWKAADAAARKHLLSLVPDMVFEIAPGTLTAHIDRVVPGTMKVTKAEGKTLWLEVTEKKPDGTTDTDNLKVELVDANTFRMTTEGTPEVVVMRRQK